MPSYPECLLLQRLCAGRCSLVLDGRGRRVCAWENSDENRGELSRVSQTLAAPANGGLVRFASSCLPTLVGRPKVRTKERQLRGSSTSTMPCSGGLVQKRANSCGRGGRGEEGGLEKQWGSIFLFLGRVQTNSAWTIGIRARVASPPWSGRVGDSRADGRSSAVAEDELLGGLGCDPDGPTWFCHTSSQWAIEIEPRACGGDGRDAMAMRSTRRQPSQNAKGCRVQEAGRRRDARTIRPDGMAGKTGGRNGRRTCRRTGEQVQLTPDVRKAGGQIWMDRQMDAWVDAWIWMDGLVCAWP